MSIDHDLAARIEAMTPAQRADLLRWLDREAGHVVGEFPVPPPTAGLPRVVSQAEYGRRGALVQQHRYDRARFVAWGRLGGRPRNPTYAQLASTGPARDRSRGGAGR